MIHAPWCKDDQDENIRTDTYSNAAPGIALRAHMRTTCMSCAAVSDWVRCDRWRFKYPDPPKEEPEFGCS